MSEVVFKINSEIGFNKYMLSVLRGGMHAGLCKGFLDYKSGVISIYPVRICAGIDVDFPIKKQFADLRWQ